jgi:phosphofructokinase-like protein
MGRKKKIGVLTAGGDCPGLNAAIRAVAKAAFFEERAEVMGIKDGFDGLIHDRAKKLEWEDVSGILTLGGTILGTNNRADPFAYGEEKKDVSRKALDTFHKLELDALVCIGGDGTFAVGHKLQQSGIPVVGIPKTIDNDLEQTDYTIGFDSAVAVATDSVDKIHTTAESHHRVMIVEVMGRYVGWLALHAGVAGGADVILIPEIPFEMSIVCEELKKRSKLGKRFSIMVVAEGVRLGKDLVIKREVKGSAEPIRLGGVSYRLAEQIEQLTGLETRVAVLGHVQRGGTPTPFDRVLATQFGKKAVDLIVAEEFGRMVSLQGVKITSVPIQSAIAQQRKVTPDLPLVQSAKAVGTCFGD